MTSVMWERLEAAAAEMGLPSVSHLLLLGAATFLDERAARMGLAHAIVPTTIRRANLVKVRR